MHSFYRTKGIIKKVYSDIVNSIKLKKRMDTIFMDSENRKIPNPH